MDEHEKVKIAWRLRLRWWLYEHVYILRWLDQERERREIRAQAPAMYEQILRLSEWFDGEGHGRYITGGAVDSALGVLGLFNQQERHLEILDDWARKCLPPLLKADYFRLRERGGQ